jgi:prefoldin subunit 5
MDTAESIQKSMAKWAKLRDEMQEQLKVKQKRLGSLEQDLPAYVESWQGLLKEVVVTLV